MISLISLIISLSLIMYLAYKGYSTIITAPIIGLLTILISNGLNAHLMANYTEVYMNGFSGFVKSYFPLFLTGAIFAKLMDDLIYEKYEEELIKLKKIIDDKFRNQDGTYGDKTQSGYAFAIFSGICIKALPVAECKNVIDTVDIVLLGPQVRFQKPQIEAMANGRIPVEVIDMRFYGTMNGKGVLESALELIK